ncbi:hypothetical protein [Gorillibacterium timonense]|uniref:hypothetical protein n=1 Tax=Gorillibacterium timonense TaxID=1689269 RepID=UPI00071CE24C|nr:hypothetical protein [Gorillibacterium timonense]
MGRILEKTLPYLIGAIPPILVIYYGIYPSYFVNFKDIMNSTISMGSIAVGFLAAAITLLPSLNQNPFVIALKQIGAYEKLMSYLISAIIFLFLISLLSIFGLLIDTSFNKDVGHIFLIGWSFVFSVAILTTIRVIFSFLKFLIASQK